MEARRLLYSAMVIAPAVLLAGIGVHSRTYVDPYNWPATSADQQRMNAYLDIVSESYDYADLHPAWQDTVDRPKLVRVANLWISETEKGKLKPLVPVAYDDMGLSGVKGQIVNSMVLVNRALVRDVDRLVDSGDTKAAVDEVLLSVRLADTLKYSSFITVYRCSLLQGTAVNRLVPIFEKLPVEKRLAVKEELKSLYRGMEPLNKIAVRAKRIYMDALHTRESLERALVANGEAASSKTFFEEAALAKEKRGVATDPIHDMIELPNLAGDATLCLEADGYLRRGIQQVLRLK